MVAFAPIGMALPEETCTASAPTQAPSRIARSVTTRSPTRRISAIRCTRARRVFDTAGPVRSEEHTSELQSPCNLVCRLLLEKKKIRNKIATTPADDAIPDDCISSSQVLYKLQLEYSSVYSR